MKVDVALLILAVAAILMAGAAIHGKRNKGPQI